MNDYVPLWKVVEDAVIETGALNSREMREPYKYSALVIWLQILEEDEGPEAARAYYEKYHGEGRSD
jgi:hypothetical protein